MIFGEICSALQLAKYIFMPATAISLDGKKVFSVKWMALVYIFYIFQWFGFQPKWLNKSTCSGSPSTKIYNTGLTAHWFYSKTVTEEKLCIAFWSFFSCHGPCLLQIREAGNHISIPRIQFRRFNSCLAIFLPNHMITPTSERLIFCPLKIHDYTQCLSLVWKPESIRYSVIQHSGKKIFIPLPITKLLLLNLWKFSTNLSLL